MESNKMKSFIVTVLKDRYIDVLAVILRGLESTPTQQVVVTFRDDVVDITVWTKT